MASQAEFSANFWVFDDAPTAGLNKQNSAPTTQFFNNPQKVKKSPKA